MTKHIKKLLGVKNLLVFALLYTVFITIAFLSPTSNKSLINFIIPIDKLIHFIIYLLLSIFWFSFLNLNKVNRLSNKTILLVLFVFVIYGIIIEGLQENLTATRKADIMDVFANIIGSITGVIVFLKVKNRIKT